LAWYFTLTFSSTVPFTLFVPATGSFTPRLLAAGLACAALMALELGQRTAVPPPAQAAWPKEVSATGAALTRLDGGRIPMPTGTPAAHASSLLALPPSNPATLMAFWFAGTRESDADVQIAASQFDRASQQWSASRFVVNRQTLGAQLGFGVRRLGNPVAWLDGSGRIHLFVVATGLGGWAAARVVHLRQSQPQQAFDSLSFEALRVLPLSWLWNTSFLVRTAPLALSDGGMVLPVHFELGIKYPVALRFDARGKFLGMVRISGRHHLLQPTLLMAGASSWLALMRDHSPQGKVAVAQTLDGGQSWTDLPDLALDNPDASVAGLALGPGRMLLAHNSSPHDRTVLDLSASAHGRHWVLAQTLAQGADEYSYPALAWADRSLWVSYTDHRKSIAWQRFSVSEPAH
jgi:predicted neuraminidase